MKAKYALLIAFGALLILASVIVGIATRGQGIDSLVLFNAGMAITLYSLIRHHRYGKRIEADELSRRVAVTSLAASFQLMLLFLIACWWIDRVFPIRLSAGQVIAILMFIMISLSLGTRFYYARRTERLL
jgi:uncharacterized membrane-anchored protein